MMALSNHGLIGAGAGFLVGLVAYGSVLYVVATIRKNAAQSPADGDSETRERQLGLLRAYALMVDFVGLPVAGYFVGEILLG